MDATSLKYDFALSAAGLAPDYATAGVASNTSISFADNGSYTVYGRVYDKDGGLSAVYSTTVVVNNVAPSVAINGAPGTSPEGTAIALGSTVTDPGTLDTLTYAWTVSKNGTAGYAVASGTTFSFTPTTTATTSSP